MRADVGQAPHCAFIVRRQNQRLAEAAIEQSQRCHSSRRLDTGGITDPLPAAREDSILLQLEVLWIRVHASRKSGSPPNVLVDLEVAAAHARESMLELCSRQIPELDPVPASRNSEAPLASVDSDVGRGGTFLTTCRSPPLLNKCTLESAQPADGIRQVVFSCISKACRVRRRSPAVCP